jgi:hypothetical protein
LARRRGDLDRQTLEAGVVEQAAFVASSPAPFQRAQGLAAGRATTDGGPARLSRESAKLPSSGSGCGGSLSL